MKEGMPDVRCQMLVKAVTNIQHLTSDIYLFSLED